MRMGRWDGMQIETATMRMRGEIQADALREMIDNLDEMK